MARDCDPPTCRAMKVSAPGAVLRREFWVHSRGRGGGGSGAQEGRVARTRADRLRDLRESRRGPRGTEGSGTLVDSVPSLLGSSPLNPPGRLYIRLEK